MGLVEMGEKEMLGEGSIRNKGSGMASGCIESPPRTVWALIKWKVGRDATGGWCRLAGYVLFHRQARHTAFQGQRSYAWRHATRCDFIEAFPALALCACSWVLNDKITPPTHTLYFPTQTLFSLQRPAQALFHPMFLPKDKIPH